MSNFASILQKGLLINPETLGVYITGKDVWVHPFILLTVYPNLSITVMQDFQIILHVYYYVKLP